MVAITRRVFVRVLAIGTIPLPGLLRQAVATDLALDDAGTWLFIDGGALPIAEFPELFAVVGRRHGGTETTFNLPDKKIDQDKIMSLRGLRYLVKARPGGADGLPVGIVIMYLGRLPAIGDG